MTRYAASSVTFFLPPGGVCKGHSLEDEPADPEYPYLSVDCPVCDPFLASHPFWASTPEERPLTGPEQRERDRLKREAEKRNMAMTDAMAQFLSEVAADRLAAKSAPEPEEEKPAAPKPRTRKTSGASA